MRGFERGAGGLSARGGERTRRRIFALLFMVMLTIAAGNTALQSVMPAIGRSLHLADTAIALSFSVSALVWVGAAPFWANRSDRKGRRNMVLLGLGGFTVSLALCGAALTAGIVGLLPPLAAFIAFIMGRLIYGSLGAAAAPAAQAMVAAATSRDERMKALTLLASAFGLGTIIGPALAPFFVLPVAGLAGPAYVFACFGLVVFITAWRMLPAGMVSPGMHGAASSYPSIGGQPAGASVRAATSQAGAYVGWRDPRVWPWLVAGGVMGHAQAMTGQAMGFLIIDRLALPLAQAQQAIGIVLMVGAGAALLAQWGIIPLLGLTPRALVVWGALLAAAGCIAVSMATNLYGLCMAFALSSLGFGFVRPGYTAGASLAVEGDVQGAVAGKVTSVNGSAFVLGPSIGIGLYEIWHPLPYLTAGAGLILLVVYGAVRLEQEG